MRRVHSFSAIFAALLLLSACSSTRIKENGAAINRDRELAQQAVELPSLLQLRDCARRDAVLSAQQQQLDTEAVAIRAEKARLAAREHEIQALRSNSSSENLKQAERDWNHASAQLKEKIDDFDRLFAPYRDGVLYQVQHCAFAQVRRQDLQQLCQEGSYPRYCARYQAYQTGE